MFCVRQFRLALYKFGLQFVKSPINLWGRYVSATEKNKLQAPTNDYPRTKVAKSGGVYFKKGKIMPDIVACPGCGAVLAKMPKARSKCPECKEWIHLKTPFKGKNPILMTKEQAKAVDQKYETLRQREENDTQRYISKISHEAVEAVMNGDFSTGQRLSLELSALTKDKEQRKIFKTQFHQCELRNFNHPDAHYVCINKSSNTQEECNITDKTIIPISHALKEMPLPCNAEYCTCFYTLVFDDELESEVEQKQKKKSWIKKIFSHKRI